MSYELHLLPESDQCFWSLFLHDIYLFFCTVLLEKSNHVELLYFNLSITQAYLYMYIPVQMYWIGLKVFSGE